MGNGAAEAKASLPARAPALALIDGHGEVVRLTETFRAGFALEESPHVSIWDFLADPEQRSRLVRVLEGRLLRADLALPSATGALSAEAEAVLDAAVTRHALLTVAPAGPAPEPRSGADVLLGDGTLDDSPAIVWIKDLEGRYLRINRRYREVLGIDEASIRGKRDAELSHAHVVAEPVLLGSRANGGEPAQLEYTVDASEGRDALTVLRFPLHGLDGTAVAVCGVAATVANAATARSEAERLLRLERWAGLSVEAIRAELIDEWQLEEVEPAEPADVPPTSGPGPAADTAAPTAADMAELERLKQELEAARLATSELESLVGAERLARSELEARLAEEADRSAKLDEALTAATRRAAEPTIVVAPDQSRVAELEAAVAAERARAEGAEGEVAAVRERVEAAEGEVAAERARTEGAEREAAAARARVQGVEREAAAARARVAEIKAEQATVTTANEQVDAARAARAELEQQLAEAVRRAEAAERELAGERAQAGQGHAELLARAEAAEAAVAEARTAGENAAAAAQRETAQAELARGRAEGLETALVSAREAEAAARAALEHARAEMTSGQGALQQAQAESEAAREAANRLERERSEATARIEHLERERSEATARIAQLERERREADAPAAELLARAEAAEAALVEARTAGEKAAAAAQRETAQAELARRRAEGLETALASAREAEAGARSALEHARAEMTPVQSALQQAQAESEAAREAANELERERSEATARIEQLELERSEATARIAQLERERREADAPDVNGWLLRAPSAPLGETQDGAVAASTSSGPTWSHGAQRALALSLADAAEWRTGLKDALRIIGTEGGWDIAVAWYPDERTKALRCTAMWMSAPDQHALFETATWQRRESPTASEVGRAAAVECSTWLDALGAIDDAQLTAAAGEGMRAALLVPIRHGEETSGVLELLTSAAGPTRPDVASAMEAVALQLAHVEYLLRRGAEPRWRIGGRL